MSALPKSIELEYVTIHYDQPIIHLVFKEGAELGFPEMRELTSYAEKLSDNRPYMVLSDVRAKVSVTPEGKRIAADIKNAPLNRGSAVLVSNNMFKIAVNFFTDFKKPVFPYKAFTDKQKAITWLLQLPLNTLSCLFLFVDLPLLS